MRIGEWVGQEQQVPPCRAAVAIAASISPTSRVGASISSTARVGAAASIARRNGGLDKEAGLNASATRETVGAICFSVFSILPMTENSKKVRPVTLPPGRARLSTKPCPTGSETATNQDMIQTVAPEGPDQALSIGVLPGRPR
jgi:hypothetical protein